jgi:hypothetical protein
MSSARADGLIDWVKTRRLHFIGLNNCNVACNQATVQICLSNRRCDIGVYAKEFGQYCLSSRLLAMLMGCREVKKFSANADL